MNERYALLVDNGVQWFDVLVKYEEPSNKDDKLVAVEHYEVSQRVRNSAFCKNVYNRPIEIRRLPLWLNSCPEYYGWHISETDYKRITRMIELDKHVAEFERLSELN